MGLHIDYGTEPTKPPMPLESYRASTLNLPGVTREDYYAFSAGPQGVPASADAGQRQGPGLVVLLLIGLLFLWGRS